MDANANVTPILRLPERAQPLPRAAKIWSERVGGVERQVIARTWDGEDWKICRLCPRGKCNVANGLCMVVYPSILPPELCALRTRVDPGPN